MAAVCAFLPHRRARPFWRAALLVVGSAFLAACIPQAPTPAAASIQQALADAAGPREHELPQEPETLRALYDQRGFAPMWHRSGRPTPQARRLAQALRDAGAHGLDPADYDAERIGAQVQELLDARVVEQARWTALDLRLSGAALRFVTHLHYGRVASRANGFALPEHRAHLDPVETVDRLAGAGDTAAVLAAVAPPLRQYRMLEAALAKYRRLALEEGLTALPAFAGRSIKAGERYAGAAALRRLLVALGDLDPEALAASSGETLDDALAGALRSFQERHGLAADGVLGSRSFAALTVPLARRARQIELTLERLRWLPEFEAPPIVVNLPEFRLYAFRTIGDSGPDLLRMDVIVGQDLPETRTPVFLAQMKYVVFRPYWDVPESIVQREMLPAIRGDSAFLARNRLELVGGMSDDSPVVPPTPENVEALASGTLRLRQQPGPGNALGAIKFVLPNNHHVYLHSTPDRRLFRESSRPFSHGCIRVSDPVALAAHVLRDTQGDWTAERIRQAMQGEPNQRVSLSRPIPVMILYATAIATASGQVRFFDDIYGHDRTLDALLRARNRNGRQAAVLRRPGPDAPRVEMQEIRASVVADPAAAQR